MSKQLFPKLAKIRGWLISAVKRLLTFLFHKTWHLNLLIGLKYFYPKCGLMALFFSTGAKSVGLNKVVMLFQGLSLAVPWTKSFDFMAIQMTTSKQHFSMVMSAALFWVVIWTLEWMSDLFMKTTEYSEAFSSLLSTTTQATVVAFGHLRA